MDVTTGSLSRFIVFFCLVPLKVSCLVIWKVRCVSFRRFSSYASLAVVAMHPVDPSGCVFGPFFCLLFNAPFFPWSSALGRNCQLETQVCASTSVAREDLLTPGEIDVAVMPRSEREALFSHGACIGRVFWI